MNKHPLKKPSIKKKRTERPISHRLRSVQEVLAGKTAVAVAAKYGDSPRAVSYWVTRFKEKGKAGLKVLPRSGRPAKLNEKQMQSLAEFVAAAEAASENLSGSAISAFLRKNFGVSVTRQHGLKLLTRIRA